MTHGDKLKAILETAKNKGWESGLNVFGIDDSGTCIVTIDVGHTHHSCDTERVIFSHPFLKTFFGEKWEDFERICRQGGETKVIPFAMKAWEFRAYELAVSENRIDYLYEFVK